MKDTDTKKTLNTLNSLLRGEISAVETYRKAVEKEKHSSDVQQLRDIQEDHAKAVRVLQSEVTKLGGKPSNDSGAWGAWAKTIEGTAVIFGDKSALKALKEGEEHGVKEYEQALSDEEVEGNCKQLIQGDLLPKQQSHIDRLDSLIQAH